MKTLPLSEVKTKLNRLVDDVSRRDEQVTITKNGKPAAVIVSPEYFEGWQETVEILADEELMSQIRRSLRRIRSREGKWYTPEELFGKAK